MRLQDHIDFTTLQWVKPELDETLSRARDALESYVDDPANAGVMRQCTDSLHQVQGTLRMVELYGAAMVAEEMETLAISLLEDHVQNRDEAYTALMRGLMQLPDYLERLSSGHRDVPVVLLPLLNELRASRDQEALPESALFCPDLNMALPAEVPAAAEHLDKEQQRSQVAALRLRFQQQLLAWFRGQSPGQQLVKMRETLLAIAGCCNTVHGRRLWWIASAVMEGLEHGALTSQAAEVRKLIGKVDRNIRQLVEQGENGLRGGDADELASKLLYIVAQTKQSSPQLDMLRGTYQLDSLLPGAGELEHARGSMSGHNRALLDSVSRALKEDLLRVKEALDLFLRNAEADPAQLAAQSEVLERVGDTLGMLALAVPRRVVNEQRRVLDEVANRMRAPDEDVLLDVAGALLYVESSLDDHIESLGAEGEVETSATPPLPRSEARHILSSLMQEAIGNTAAVKEAIVAFVESGWKHAELEKAPALMDQVAGAMRMLSATRAGDLAEGIGRFVSNELLADRRVPGNQQMDHLADTLSALDYYLEAAREHRGGLEHILDVAEHSLGQLGYWPLPAARPLAERQPDAPAHEQPYELELSESVTLAEGSDVGDLIVGEMPLQDSEAHDVAGMRLAQTESLAEQAPASAAESGAQDEWIEEQVVEMVPAADEFAANAGFQLSTDGIDDDIREIFLEEVQEEIDNLLSAQKDWLADPDQLPALIPIRRSFHTLKGSGRLVGASVLGEFSWKVENMLNRVLDESITPGNEVQALIGHAIAALPQLLTALKGEGTPDAPLGAIMQTADQLAAGEHGRIEDHAPTGMREVTRTVRRRVEPLHEAAASIPEATHTDQSASAGEEPHQQPETIDLPVMPSVDPVLLEILRSEVAQYLQTIRTSLQQDGDEMSVDDSLLRAVHTLHGAIAMVDIPMLTQLLSPLESLLKRLRAAGEPLTAEGKQLLAQVADVVDQAMAQFDAPAPQLPSMDQLTDRLIEMRDVHPEPKVAHVVFDPQADDEADELDAAWQVSDEETVEPAAIEPSSEDDDIAAEMMAALGQFDADTAIPLDSDVPGVVASDETTDPSLQALLDGLLEEDAVDADDLSGVASLEPENFTEEDHEALVKGLIVADEDQSNADPVETEAGADADADAGVDAVEPDSADEGVAAIDAADASGADLMAANAEPEVEGEPAPELQPVAPVASVEEVEEVEEAADSRGASADDEEPVAGSAVGTDEPSGISWVGQIDPDLLEVFTEEANEILDHADGILAQWRAEPTERAHVSELQRDLHTLKGGARIAGLVPVGDLTHAIETLLEKPVGQDADRDAQLIGALESGFDKLHALVQRVSQSQPIDYPQAMIDRFLALAGEEALVDNDEFTVPQMAAAESRPVAAAAPSAAGQLPELLPEMEDEARAPQEQIRVRAELLDSLVNHAGEVAIYRSRLEQQVAGYRFNLVELEQTVARLRSQLRMLEIETEAQIIARFQREHREAGMAVFDPLELDRFSQLQQYSRALAESVSDLVSIQNMLDELTRQAETLLIQQSRVSSELQEGLLRTRMLPFDTMVPNLRRTLRQAAQEEGKSAHLHVEGAHGEMDRNLLDRIKAPFEHMLRNAIAHGIESPAERRKAGKPAEGSVHIRVAREATEVVIRVTDDGRGLNREAIRKRAIERGLLRAEARPSDDQLLSLITQAGFSTASTVTQLAGRGVGMDVVANEIKQLGGSLAIESKEGQGTTFVLRLPFTLAVTQAILVRIGEATFAIPMTSVQGVARISPEDLAERLAEDAPTFTHGGEDYGIHDLADLLGLPPSHSIDEALPPLLLTRAGDLRAAIRIDAVLGSREIVVKSVGPQISSVPGLLGATIMGDGSVLIILDLAPLVRHGIARREQRLAEGLSAVPTPVIEEVRVRPLVMVVDDSITMRKVTGRILERHEYEISTAKDGVDALEKLHERIPDMMLLDIEMPRMDGYELATHMKADPKLCDIPIIMITSRSGEKHRQRAFDIGVDRYLGKPYQENELLAQIAEVLEQRTEQANG